jgi:hypothetical protein
MPENLQCYFDTEAFAPDMVLRGDITKVEINGTDYMPEAGVLILYLYKNKALLV